MMGTLIVAASPPACVVFTDRRGVSEALGFVLVFALVVTTVGVVYTVGFGGLQDARNAERVNNAERAFDILANNVEDIVRRGVPSRGTEIRLADASIGSGEPTYVNVSGTAASGRNFSSGTYALDPVVYEADDTQIRYTGGAVTRVQPGGSTMLNRPPFVLHGSEFVVPLVQLSTDEASMGGHKTVLVRAERRIRQVVVSEHRSHDTVTMNVSTPAPDGWERYLEDEGMTCTRHDQPGDRAKLSCEMNDVQRVHIVWYEIKVTFE